MDRQSQPQHPWLRRVLTLSAAITAMCWLSIAAGQPATTAARPPGALQPGHPVPGQAPPARRPAGHRSRLSADQMQRLRELAKRRGLGGHKQPVPPPPPAARHDEHAHTAHGECLGHGPKDRPGEINLAHGWLGVNNDKAAVEPRRNSAFDTQWWKWRLTPYPWRYQNKQDHCDPRNEPVPLLANIANLALLLFLLVRFGRKPLAEALRKRRKTIMKEIDRAGEIKAAARDRLAHYQAELGQLDEKLSALRDKYRLEGQLEEQRLADEAGRARARLLAGAEFRVTQEGKAAHETLSRQALKDALRAAEQLLVGKVSDADHERLAEEYLEQLSTTLRADRRKGTP